MNPFRKIFSLIIYLQFEYYFILDERVISIKHPSVRIDEYIFKISY